MEDTSSHYALLAARPVELEVAVSAKSLEWFSHGIAMKHRPYHAATRRSVKRPARLTALISGTPATRPTHLIWLTAIAMNPRRLPPFGTAPTSPSTVQSQLRPWSVEASSSSTQRLQLLTETSTRWSSHSPTTPWTQMNCRAETTQS